MPNKLTKYLLQPALHRHSFLMESLHSPVRPETPQNSEKLRNMPKVTQLDSNSGLSDSSTRPHCLELRLKLMSLDSLLKSSENENNIYTYSF